MLAAQEHLRTKKRSRFKDEPLWETATLAKKGHRQISEENLIRWGFTETDIVSDRIPTKQNWDNKFQIDKRSFDTSNSRYGKPINEIKKGGIPETLMTNE